MTRAPFQRRDRCVHCGVAKAQHVELDGNLICAGSSGRAGKCFATLNLPEGKTCGDCHHIARCQAIFGHIPEDQTCDFFPIRYLERAQ